MVNYCCVPTCHSNTTDKRLSFHTFTRNPILQKVWTNAIKRDHGKSNNNKRPFIANKNTRICSKHFKQDDFLHRSPTKKVLKATAVPSIFPWSLHSSQLDRHVQRNHRNVNAAELFHAIVELEQFTCIWCYYKSHYQFELYEHYKQAHNPRTEDMSFRKEFERYPCGCCGFTTDSSLCLVKHHVLCEKASPSEGPREDAENALNRADARASKNFGTNETNTLSRDSSKRNEIYFLVCTHCSYQAKHISTMAVHVLRHAKIKEINWFRCNQCSYRAKEKSALKKHMIRHAKDEEIDWLQCSQCTFRAKRKAYLKKHMLRHAKEEEINWFQCNLCAYRTKYKAHLKTHMLQHAKKEEIDWFQCSVCSYRTMHKSHLKTHMLKHAKSEEIDWFKCNLCAFRAKQKSDLKRHMLIKHTNN